MNRVQLEDMMDGRKRKKHMHLFKNDNAKLFKQVLKKALKEVPMITKESQKGGNPILTCSMDFTGMAQFINDLREPFAPQIEFY